MQHSCFIRLAFTFCVREVGRRRITGLRVQTKERIPCPTPRYFKGSTQRKAAQTKGCCEQDSCLIRHQVPVSPQLRPPHLWEANIHRWGEVTPHSVAKFNVMHWKVVKTVASQNDTNVIMQRAKTDILNTQHWATAQARQYCMRRRSRVICGRDAVKARAVTRDAKATCVLPQSQTRVAVAHRAKSMTRGMATAAVRISTYSCF